MLRGDMAWPFEAWRCLSKGEGSVQPRPALSLSLSTHWQWCSRSLQGEVGLVSESCAPREVRR